MNTISFSKYSRRLSVAVGFVNISPLPRRALLVYSMLVSLLAPAHATQFEISGPPGSGAFGSQTVVLPNGNIVITDPNYGEGGKANVGAVYLYDGATLALISTLKGGTANDLVGGGTIVVLANGNFVVPSGAWDNGPAVNAGAVTFCHAATGCDGVVSNANSLVGSTSGDFVGDVNVPPNGGYVVTIPNWDRTPTARNVGAVVHCDGTVGCAGPVGALNPLTGSAENDQVGIFRINILADGDYVVNSPRWAGSSGAVTFCRAATGCAGAISSANSLVGATGQSIGSSPGSPGSNGVVALSNGNYVVASAFYIGPDAQPSNPNPYGAVTFCDGTKGCSGTVGSNTSLVGSTHGQSVGIGGVTALPNGSYVVNSPRWDNGAVTDAGAVTFCDGTTGCGGTVSASNSLIGSTTADSVGNAGSLSALTPQFFNPVTVLTDGNYVVTSPNWDNGASADAGAVTWCSGTTGCAGAITSANSLVGSTANDRVGAFGSRGVASALKNGDYVVNSPFWDKPSPAVTDAGAVTFCNGATNSCAGQVVSTANSLTGSTAGDLLGSGGTTTVTGCTGAGGGYVVLSPNWSNGAAARAGAATFCNGETGCAGSVSPTNSLVGSRTDDLLGASVHFLPGGNYVVASWRWDNGAATDVGAVSFCDGASGCVGAINSSNSLVGSTSGDQLGDRGVKVLANGNYLVTSQSWDDGPITDAGAVTWCRGTAGCRGPVSAANSLVGSKTSDQVGSAHTLLNGNYVVVSPSWDNGATANAGAVTFASGTSGASGAINSLDSVLGTAPGGGNLTFGYDEGRNRLFVGRAAGNVVNVIFFDTTAVADGNLSDPATWSGGVPNAISNVRIPAGRTVTVDTPSSVGNLSVESGANLVLRADLRLTGNLTTGAQIDTGASRLSLSCSTGVAGASAAGYVVGNVEKQFCAAGAFTYPTGTASGYSPVSVEVTGLCANPSSLTVRASQGTRAGMNPAQTAQRYWTLTETGDLTLGLSFNYLDGDVVGEESGYKLYKWEGEAATLVPSTQDAGANSFSASGISDFSDWAIGNVGGGGDNTAPTVTAEKDVTRQAGAPPSNSRIAFVSDAESGGGVVLTVASANPSNGVTISNIVNAGGTVTADIVASCDATDASFTLQANDGSSIATASFNVTVSENAAPALSYDAASVTYGGSTTISPATGPTDNGAVASIAVRSQGTYTGAISVDGSGVVSIDNAANAGTHTITIRAADDCGATRDATFTLQVNKAVLTVMADDQSKQYSDPVPPLSYAVTGFVNGDTAGAVSGAPLLSTAATRFGAPGRYPINVALGTLSATNYTFDQFVNGTLTVGQEDARAHYTGSLFVNTSCATCGGATVTLAATIKDITAEAADPAYDPDAGDVRNANVTFIDRDTNRPIATVPVNPVAAGDGTVGTAVFNWNVDIGSADSEDRTIGMLVGNYYADDSAHENVVVTISKPLETGFLTGGGYLVSANSAGPYQAAPGTNTNFGFNVKYGNSGRSLNGRVNVIVRSGGRVIQIKGNVMLSLAVNDSNPLAKAAVFTGKATVTDITDPYLPVSLGGNNTFQIGLTDRGEPGSADSIAISVWDSDGGLLFSSSWDGTRSSEQSIGGGDLVVH